MLCCSVGGFDASYGVDACNRVDVIVSGDVDLTDSCHSLDKLAHVLAERLAAGPLALAVSVERVRGRVFLVGRAVIGKEAVSCVSY